MSKNYLTRGGHGGGFCSLAYETSGKSRKLITCGSDTLIKVHDLDRYEEEGHGVEDVDHFGQAVSAVAVSPDGTRFAAGGDDRLVALFTMEDNEFERNVTRFPLPVRDLKFDNDGQYLAVASDDAEIKLVNVTDTEDIKTLEGHDGGVKSLAFNPAYPLLASSGADRTVRFWDLETHTEKGKITQCYSKEAASASLDGAPVNLCSVDWTADGTLLAVAGGLDVKAVSRETLQEVEGFKGGHIKNVSMVKFSKNGLYLMSIDEDGVVVIWDVENRESIRRFENPAKVLSGAWDPFTNAVALIADDGKYGMIPDVIPDDKPGPNEKVAGDGDGASVGDESDIDADLLDDDDFLKITGGESPEKAVGGGGGRSGMRYESARRNEPQAPFQPQSTPTEHKRRFLVFNHVGNISCRTEIAFNAIEIEFADINAHRAIRFNDFSGFSMAAMDNHGAIFASAESKERGGEVNPSQLHYRHFDPWAVQSDWTMALDAGESATAVTCGASFVAVATSHRLLRIFATSGLQTHVEMFAGAALCMHGHGNLLAFVHHTPVSPGPDDSQDLVFTLLDTTTRKGVAGGRVSLSPGATLEWLQVTDNNMVATMDSEGYVNVFAPALGLAGAWVPVLDIKKRNKPRDWFWPIRLDGECLTGVVCKEEKRFPDVLQPVLGRFELNMPLVKADAPEEEMLRGSLFVAASGVDDEEEVAARRLDLDKKLLQLINAACTAKKLLRALDLAKQIANEKALEAAITLAKRHRLSNLAERIDMYRQVRFAEEEEVEEEEGGWGVWDARTATASERRVASSSALKRSLKPSGLADTVRRSAYLV
mmetsp:Transcript_34186/g.80997  ORF Transcript_34186/g.80997 Transcript_34186/m.80997 type:complete len:821 (-) Transcript_34186:46-2508(-)